MEKKSYLDFKWDGDDFVIDVDDVYVQNITGMVGVDYYPALYINKELALEMGWFVKRGSLSYGLGPNLVMEALNDEMPLP